MHCGLNDFPRGHRQVSAVSGTLILPLQARCTSVWCAVSPRPSRSPPCCDCLCRTLCRWPLRERLSRKDGLLSLAAPEGFSAAPGAFLRSHPAPILQPRQPACPGRPVLTVPSPSPPSQSPGCLRVRRRLPLQRGPASLPAAARSRDAQT